MTQDAPSTTVHVDQVRTGDGVRLALHRLGPGSGVPALLVPGTFSNHTFWLGTRGRGFARALAAEGYEAWVLDPRGHGDSQRPAAGDDWDFDDWARRDLPAAIRAASRDHTRRIFLVGHSAGGAASLIALAAEPGLQDSVRGVVVIGTPVPWMQMLRGILARATRRISLLLGRFPARLVGLGPEDELPGVMAQWMGWNVQGHWRGDDGTDYERELDDVRVPVFVLAGAGDRIFAPPRACHALYSLIGARDKQYQLVGRVNGLAEDFGHVDIMIGRAAEAEVWPRILNWLHVRT